MVHTEEKKKGLGNPTMNLTLNVFLPLSLK